MREQLEIFLKHNHCYDEFVINCNNRISGVGYYCVVEEDCPISSSFDWDDTAQGYDFWEEIDDKWDMFYNTKNNLHTSKR